MAGCERNISWKDVPLPHPHLHVSCRQNHFLMGYIPGEGYAPSECTPFPQIWDAAGSTAGTTGRISQGAAKPGRGGTQCKALPNHDIRGPSASNTIQAGMGSTVLLAPCAQQSFHRDQPPRGCILNTFPGRRASGPDSGWYHRLLSLTVHLPLRGQRRGASGFSYP